jgi:hypothetical protein
MVTLAGIPLFYPFIKILVYFPNPEMRIVPGIFVKKELFFYVLLSNFFMQDLFANGFGPQSIIISTM